MKVSIRESTMPEGVIRLQVFRPRERKPLPGWAHQTKCGNYWVIYLPGILTDVTETEADAAFQLQEFYRGKP